MPNRQKIAIFILLMVFLAGCARHGKLDLAEMGAGGESSFSPSVAGAWRDNSMDLYSADFIRTIKYTEQENELDGGILQYFLEKDSAVVFKKHLFEKPEDSWDEMRFFAENGEDASYKLAFWPDRLNQAFAAGRFYDGNHCLMVDIRNDEKEELQYWFVETDETMHVVRDFCVDGFAEKGYEIFQQILVDNNGNIHVMTKRNSDNMLRYGIILSGSAHFTEWKTETEDYSKRHMKLCYLYDGRVAVLADGKIMLGNEKTGEMETLTEFDQEWMTCVIWDENTLLYADGDGLCKCDLSGNQKEILYRWENHGIIPYGIVDVRIGANTDVSLLCETQGGVIYLRLSPTVEEVPVVKIQFAVSSWRSSKYEQVVAGFNRTHPSYHIDMKEYEWNDTGLLTKILAKDGPQLVDSSLVGFQDHANVWEPLDDFYGQLDVELIPEALEFGKINGVSYGFVTEFAIDTMVTFSESPAGWDYEAFLDYLTDAGKGKKSPYNAVNGMDGNTFAMLFYHDLSESFLYDAENCDTKFDGENFQKIMKLSKLYSEPDHQADYEDFLQGNSPCAIVEIMHPADLAALRVMGGGRLRFIGFPTQTGSVNYLVGNDPLCILASADAKEKQASFAFLRFLLTDEAQNEKDDEFAWWSVRKDLVKKRFEQMDESVPANLVGFPSVPLKGQLNPAGDFETMQNLLENARPKKSVPMELRMLLMEELEDYLSEGISEETLKGNLKNRVELFLNEQR